MPRLLTNSALLVGLSLGFVAVSIYFDRGNQSWIWFQRSGAIVTLAGAVLTYRSVVRLGEKGVGGAQPLITRGRVVSVDDSGPVQMMRVEHDAATTLAFRQHGLDQRAGLLGACLVVLGTAIWGYGDLLGRLF